MNMMCRTFLLCFLCCAYSLLWAQEPSYRNISSDQDIPSNEVYSLLQDQEGFLWIGCDAGLFRYNGVRFVAYKAPTQRSKSITGLLQTPNGRIYCYNFTGQVFYVENDQMYEIESLREHLVACIAPVPDSNAIWVASQDGLIMYEVEKEKEKKIFVDTDAAHTLRSKPIWRVSKDAQGSTWIQSEVQLYQLNKQGQFNKTISLPMNLHSFLPRVIYDGQHTWMWEALSTKCYRLNAQGHFEAYILPALERALEGKKITELYLDRQKRIWILTYTGAVIFDPNTQSVHSCLEQFSLSCFLQDSDGAVWLSTLHNGLLYIADLRWENWHSEDRILKLSHDMQHIYYSNTSGTLFQLHPQTGYKKNWQLPTRSDIRSIVYDIQDESLYFNTNSILYRLKDGVQSIVNDQLGALKDLCHTPQGYVVASSAGVFWLKKIEEATFNNSKDELMRRFINLQWARALAYDSQGAWLWIASNKGLLQMHFKDSSYITKNIYLQDRQVLDVLWEAQEQALFALDFEGYLYTWQAGSKQLQKFARLPESVQGYAIDKHQAQIWVATNRGLWRWDMVLKQWTQLDRTEGLISDDVLDLCVFQEKLWLATAKGLQSLPLSYHFDKKPAQIVLKALYQAGRAQNPQEKLRLEAHETLELHLEALCYFSAEKFRYAYRFDSDSSWTYLPAGTESLVLSTLPAGKLGIEVKVIDHKGRSSANSLRLRGEVLPPFWQRPWVQAMWAVLLVSLAALIFTQVLKRLQQRQQETLKRVALENELQLWQQTALQAQMSPHFLFNVLNSIKTYIYENDKAKAIHYLNLFANLVRKVLQSSQKNTIRLSEELDLLADYIALEGMLFEEDFEWRIEVPEDLPTDDWQVPTSLLQAFVENAFKHGLRYKKGLKQLWLRVHAPDASCLCIEVEDNGVGRAKSAEINARHQPKHHSFALHNIRKRIDLLNQNEDFCIEISFTDKKDEAQVPLGTLVVIKLQTNT